MVDVKKILLVEGEADRGFFEEIVKKFTLETSVLVAPPRDIGGTHNTKGGVANHLKNIVLPQLTDGQITHVAVVVDADYVEHGGGYQKTIERIAEIVKPFGFELDQDTRDGICFQHNDGLADLGLWIMPDNTREGMLEDWIKSCINESEQALFQQALDAVRQISTPKFSEHLTSKAEIATWLAWQKQPGHGLYGAMKDALLDGNAPLFKELKQWLTTIFAQTLSEPS